MKYNIFLFIIFLFSPALLFADRKKLYISEFQVAENVSEDLAKQIRAGLKLKILEAHGSDYYIVGDEDISLMYKEAVESKKKGCFTESCVIQIGDTIQADEMIYGELRSTSENKLILTMTNLLRHPRTRKIVVKSSAQKEFEQQSIDFYAGEFGEKMMNPRYTILNVAFKSDVYAKFDPIAAPESSEKELPVFSFQVGDASLKRIEDALQEKMREADESYGRQRFLRAKRKYEEAISGIWENIGSDTVRKLEPLVLEFHRRQSLAVQETYKEELRSLDKQILHKAIDPDDVDDFIEDYEDILDSLNDEAERRYYKSYSTRASELSIDVNGPFQNVKTEMNRLLYRRLAELVRIKVEIEEEKYDSYYKKYRFKDASRGYTRLLDLIQSSPYFDYGLSPLQKRLAIKQEQTWETAAALESNEIISLLDQAQYNGLLGNPRERNTIMVRLHDRIDQNELVKRDVFDRYNELAGLWSLPEVKVYGKGTDALNQDAGNQNTANDWKDEKKDSVWTGFFLRTGLFGTALYHYDNYKKLNKEYNQTDIEGIQSTFFLKAGGLYSGNNEFLVPFLYSLQMKDYRQKMERSKSIFNGLMYLLVADYLLDLFSPDSDSSETVSNGYTFLSSFEFRSSGYVAGFQEPEVLARYTFRF